MADRPGVFYPPFREGWWYEGATYAGHSNYSVDWNRRTATGGYIEDRGDPVLAAADGTVAEVDRFNGLVMLNHFGGLWRTEYRHMEGITVAVGEKVRRGDRIGSIGNVSGDGRSLGPHLHHVHWRRDHTGEAFRRTKMAFLGRPVETSVADSDTRPPTWRPPAPVRLQGPKVPPPVPAPGPGERVAFVRFSRGVSLRPLPTFDAPALLRVPSGCRLLVATPTGGDPAPGRGAQPARWVEVRSLGWLRLGSPAWLPARSVSPEAPDGVAHPGA
jgi:murein DD-endopeptidase MepM/ murein hydrolase activator NlpD